MPIVLDPKSPKKHVNLTLREDLYGVAQQSAQAAGLSVSALFDRWLLALALQEVQSTLKDRPDSEIAELHGVLSGSRARITKQDARALRHEARINKGAR